MMLFLLRRWRRYFFWQCRRHTNSVSLQNVPIHSASFVNHPSIAFFSSSLVSFLVAVFLLFERLSQFDFPIIIPLLIFLFTFSPLILITVWAINSKRIYLTLSTLRIYLTLYYLFIFKLILLPPLIDRYCRLFCFCSQLYQIS